MAGHSHFANIKHKKAAQDAKKGKLFTKVQKEIMVALQSGSPDVNSNSKLANAITKAKYFNLPKDRIDNIVKKYSGQNVDEGYEELRYNVSLKHGISVIVECLTNNRNRTAGEIRAIATKYSGILAETGSLEFSFERIGIITYGNEKTIDEVMEIAMNFDVQNIEEADDEILIITQFENTHKVSKELQNSELGAYKNVEIIWQSTSPLDIDNEKTEYLNKIIDLIEDLDDVQNVYHNVNI